MSEKNADYFVNKVIANFGDELKKYEPEYDLPYMLFGSFALLVCDLIKSKKINEKDLLEKAKIIIEEMASTNVEEVNDLFMVGFLEVFADDKNSIEYAKDNLSRQVNKSLMQILKFWGGE